jgi:hypothetical protein
MPSLVTLVDGTVPVAADFNGNYSALNAAIGSSTAISAWAIGEIPYASAVNTLSRLTPGSTGQVLTIAGGIPAWAGGAWVTPAFNAGDFTASGSQTWTVIAGNVTTYGYTLVGKTMTVAFNIASTSVGGTPSTELRIKVPTGATVAKTILVPIRIVDNGAAAVVGIAQVSASGTFISCYKDLSQTANWSASTNTGVAGEITFEIS